MYGEFKLFGEKRCDAYFEGIKDKIKKYIEDMDELKFLKSDKDSIVEYLLKNYKIEPLEIDIENNKKELFETFIPGRNFPHLGFDVRPDQNYKVRSIQYKIPFKGNNEIFNLIPKQRSGWSEKVHLEEKYICFEIPDFTKKAEDVKSKANRIMDLMIKLNEFLRIDIEEYNQSLKLFIGDLIKTKENRIKENKNFLESL